MCIFEYLPNVVWVYSKINIKFWKSLWSRLRASSDILIIKIYKTVLSLCFTIAKPIMPLYYFRFNQFTTPRPAEIANSWLLTITVSRSHLSRPTGSGEIIVVRVYCSCKMYNGKDQSPQSQSEFVITGSIFNYTLSNQNSN